MKSRRGHQYVAVWVNIYISLHVNSTNFLQIFLLLNQQSQTFRHVLFASQRLSRFLFKKKSINEQKNTTVSSVKMWRMPQYKDAKNRSFSDDSVFLFSITDNSNFASGEDIYVNQAILSLQFNQK